MDSDPVCDCVCLTIDAMFNFDGDIDVDVYADVKCEQTRIQNTFNGKKIALK